MGFCLRLICLCLLWNAGYSLSCEAAELRAGAAQLDVTPVSFPVIVNGMVEERAAERAADVLMSRAGIGRWLGASGDRGG